MALHSHDVETSIMGSPLQSYFSLTCPTRPCLSCTSCSCVLQFADGSFLVVMRRYSSPRLATNLSARLVPLPGSVSEVLSISFVGQGQALLGPPPSHMNGQVGGGGLNLTIPQRSCTAAGTITPTFLCPVVHCMVHKVMGAHPEQHCCLSGVPLGSSPFFAASSSCANVTFLGGGGLMGT